MSPIAQRWEIQETIAALIPLPRPVARPIPTPVPAKLLLLPTRAPAGQRRLSALAAWHLLSLDAPSVAALWVVFVGWSAGVRVSFADPLSMFLAVWMLYAADRLLDARPLLVASARAETADLEERHRFHHTHRKFFVPFIAAAAFPLAYLLHRLAPPVLHLYALLVCLLADWLLLVHVRPAPSAGVRRLPKEFAVGVFFPAAVFIPTVARGPGLRLALLPGALFFAGVCTLNCLFLYAWEHPLDRTRAHASTRWAMGHLVPSALWFTLAATAFAAAVSRPEVSRHIGWTRGPHLEHPASLPAACALSAASLLLLHVQRHRLPSLTLRALADVALLTPLLVFALAAVVAAAAR